MDLRGSGEPRAPVLRRPLSLRASHDLPTLWEIASTNPWLSVSPVSGIRQTRLGADCPDVRPPGPASAKRPTAEVVSRYGGWGDRQILICGRPAMVATRAALLAKGALPVRIQHDPLSG